MSNLPLQPLVWIEISEKVRNDPSICELDKGALWIADDNLVFRYNIKNNPNSKELPFIVNYGGRQPKEVDSVEYGKHWAEFTHYASQMQPYVKPSPTWIDVIERLPERKELLTDKDKCLVLTECGKVWTGFYNMHIKPNDWYLHGWAEKQGWHPFKIVAWMLASEFSTMQNLRKGE